LVSLQALRAVAAVLVVIKHAGQIARGDALAAETGVDIFLSIIVTRTPAEIVGRPQRGAGHLRAARLAPAHD
jgi:peptidoglycan/LPS O-acetylase OafA/YrhL